MRKNVIAGLLATNSHLGAVMSMEEQEIVALASQTTDPLSEEIEEIEGDTAELVVETGETGDAIDTVAKIEAKIVQMEEMQNTPVSKQTLVFCQESISVLLGRFDLSLDTISTESLDSEEGRAQALALTTEGLKEKAGEITAAIKTQLGKIATRGKEILTRIFSTAARLQERANKLAAAAEAAKGKEPAKATVKVAKGTLRALSAGQKVGDVKAIAAALVKSNQGMLADYVPKLMDYIEKGLNGPTTPLPAASALAGLPQDPEIVLVTGMYPNFHTANQKQKLSGEDREVKVMSPADIEAAAKSIATAMGLVRDHGMKFLRRCEAVGSANSKILQTNGLIDGEANKCIRIANATLSTVSAYTSYQFGVAGKALSYLALNLNQYK